MIRQTILSSIYKACPYIAQDCMSVFDKDTYYRPTRNEKKIRYKILFSISQEPKLKTGWMLKYHTLLRVSWRRFDWLENQHYRDQQSKRYSKTVRTTMPASQTAVPCSLFCYQGTAIVHQLPSSSSSMSCSTLFTCYNKKT